MKMKKLYLFILLILSTALYGKELRFQYYTEHVIINYDESLCINYSLRLSDQNIKEYYNKLEKTNYKVLLKELERVKIELELDDFFYYKLIKKVSIEMFRERDENYKIAFCWFVLNKLGYDANLRYVSSDLLNIYIYSNDTVNSTDNYKYNGKKYVCLVFNPLTTKYGKQTYILKYFPNKKGKEFKFSIDKLPRLSNSEIITKTFSYKSYNDDLSFKVKINKTIIDLLDDYPQLSSSEYFKVKLSKECYSSIDSVFQKRIKSMNKEEAIRFFLSFVRVAIKYENDRVAYGRERPMVAEEVLYYSLADCEDKSALFFCLVKSFLDVDMVVLGYPDHVNVAVLLDKVYGKPFVYKNKNYSVCETSVAGDSENAGIGYNPEYENYANPKIIYEYHHKK
jgi:hypothetical protein